jgi:NitT/TauT family transport system permease protein
MFRVRSRKFSSSWGLWLGAVPFLLIVLSYGYFSHQRLAENPKDKLLPGPARLLAGWKDVTRLRSAKVIDYTVADGETLESIARKISGSATFVEEIRTPDGKTATAKNLAPGTVLRVPKTERYITKDLWASLWRLCAGVSIAVSISLAVGLSMGVFAPVEKLLYPLVSALSKIPPLAILPIIFIFLGATNEAPRITIIALGIAPVIIMDTLLRCREVATELITKAYTLGATTLEVVFKVVLPQIWPGFLNSTRISLGPAWVFLIAAEAISADAGLGYRIFVVQRQLGMNIILIYVGIIMLIGLAIDAGLRWFIHHRYRWAHVR